MDEPLISVVIPAYKAEKRLNRCLESVCAQSWKNLEIFVVDDGSPDGTGEIAEAWEKKDPRVRAIHQPNAGVSAARNRGLAECRGEWVRFVDADDILPEDSIARLYARAKENGSDLVIAGYEQHVGELVIRANLADRDETLTVDRFLPFLNKYANSFFCGVLWNKLFRRDLIEKKPIRFEGGLGYGEDFLFVCEYLKEAEKITFSRDNVYCYVRHPHSMTFSQTWDSFQHPIRNLKAKMRLYRGLRNLFQERGAYEQYRKTLWLYLFRATLNS